MRMCHLVDLDHLASTKKSQFQSGLWHSLSRLPCISPSHAILILNEGHVQGRSAQRHTSRPFNKVCKAPRHSHDHSPRPLRRLGSSPGTQRQLVLAQGTRLRRCRAPPG